MKFWPFYGNQKVQTTLLHWHQIFDSKLGRNLGRHPTVQDIGPNGSS